MYRQHLSVAHNTALAVQPRACVSRVVISSNTITKGSFVYGAR